MTKIAPNQPLNPKVLIDYAQTCREAGILESLVVSRLNHILTLVFREFGGHLKNWYFDDASEGQIGDLAAHMNTEYIWGYWTDSDGVKDEMIIFLKDGKLHELSEIPVRWLTEDFEQELRDGRAKYLEEQEQKKNKVKEAKKAAKEAALQKLTKQERKVLGL